MEIATEPFFEFNNNKQYSTIYKITDEAIDWLALSGFDPQYGARPVKRVFQHKVLNELSKQILAGIVNKDEPIVLDDFEGELVFRKKV